MARRFATVDEYVESFPLEVQVKLEAMRSAVRAAVPGATETMSYGMPTYRLDGRAIVHVAAWTSFISVYPLPEGDEDFERELAPYRATRATARFPLAQPLPLALVARLVGLLAAQRPAGAED